jgi:hypothetical protein
MVNIHSLSAAEAFLEVLAADANVVEGNTVCLISYCLYKVWKSLEIIHQKGCNGCIK